MTTPTGTVDARAVELSSDLVTYAARLVRAVRRIHDLPAGVRILSLLDEHGALTVSAMAEADRSSQPTMSAAVNGLVANGWATKQPNPDDARSSVVSLTAEGAAELARARHTYGESIAARLAADPDHTTEDLATTVAVLRGLLDQTDTERRTL